MLTDTPTPKKVLDDRNADPNLLLQQQQKLAMPVSPTGDPVIPPPPALTQLTAAATYPTPLTPPALSDPGVGDAAPGAGDATAVNPSLGIRSLTSMGGGTASDVGTPSQQIGTSVPLTSSQQSPANGPATNPTPGGPYKPSDVAIGSTILPNGDPRFTKLQGLVDDATGKLANVDRTKLAEDMFGQFAEASDPAYKLGLRRATQSAAGAGRIGSGMLRTSYGDLANQRAQQLDLAKRGFMSDALKGTIQDQFDKVNALSGLEGQQFGEGQSTRNELRGERGYQGQLEDQAFQRALEQWSLQQQSQQQQFANGATETQLGEASNPAALYESLAGNSSDALQRAIQALRKP